MEAAVCAWARTVNLDDRNLCRNPRKLPNRQYDTADVGEAPILPAMVTISITPTAFEVIAATLPTGYTAEGRPDGQGGYVVTLDRHVIERLAAMRRPHES